MPANRRRLGNTYFELSRLYQMEGRSEEAEKACRQALGIFGKLVADHSETFEFTTTHGALHGFLADLLKASAKPAEALDACDRAIATRTPVLRKHPMARNNLRHVRLGRAQVLALSGDHAAGIAEAVEVEKNLMLADGGWIELFHLAGAYSLAAAAAGKDAPTGRSRTE